MKESKRILKQSGQQAENDLEVHLVIHTKSDTG